MITTLVILAYVLIGILAYCCFLRKKIKCYMSSTRLGTLRQKTVEEAISDLDEGDYFYCITAAILWPITFPADLLCTAFYALNTYVLMPAVRKSLEGELAQNDENSEAQNAGQMVDTNASAMEERHDRTQDQL